MLPGLFGSMAAGFLMVGRSAPKEESALLSHSLNGRLLRDFRQPVPVKDVN
jgi:hypothetical protein